MCLHVHTGSKASVLADSSQAPQDCYLAPELQSALFPSTLGRAHPSKIPVPHLSRIPAGVTAPLSALSPIYWVSAAATTTAAAAAAVCKIRQAYDWLVPRTRRRVTSRTLTQSAGSEGGAREGQVVEPLSGWGKKKTDQLCHPIRERSASGWIGGKPGRMQFCCPEASLDYNGHYSPLARSGLGRRQAGPRRAAELWERMAIEDPMDHTLNLVRGRVLGMNPGSMDSSCRRCL